MLSKNLEHSLLQAIYEAKQRNHEYVTIEHIFYILLSKSKQTQTILEYCGANMVELKQQVNTYLQSLPSFESGKEEPPVQTMAFQRAITRILDQVQNAKKKEATEIDMLLAFFYEPNSQAIRFLEQQGIERISLLAAIHAIAQQSELPLTSQVQEEPQKELDESKVTPFTVNLTKQAHNDEKDPLIGRTEEINRILQILCRRKQNNPLLLGESGVGKTAIIEGLAKELITREQLPESLQDVSILSLDMAAVLAGTKFRGDFEQRFKDILEEVKHNKKIILFIDEIHTLIGAGSTNNSTVDASSLLKPFLSDGTIRCIGITTHDEYRQHFSKEKALVRRFQSVHIQEPTQDEAIAILQGLKSKYEDHFGITYAKDALEAAVILSSQYITGKFLPDKAINVIDEAAARHILSIQPIKRSNTISLKEIEQTVSSIARVPVRSYKDDKAKKQLKNLEQNIKKNIFGQDEVIEQIITCIKRNKAGLSMTTQPIGSFLFTGATGVGKTELSIQLAKQLDIHFERIDMSEYMEKHAVSRLIGSPPGYVGFEQGGILTEKINQHPHCVLLLDEIEKAHVDIYNILLQIMDYASLTDNNGNKTDFSNVILIMTSNLGSREKATENIGFQNLNLKKEETAITRHFSSEFLNRLDAIVSFNDLTQKIMLNIVSKFLSELESKLSNKNISLQISRSAKMYLAKKGYSKTYGGRPTKRLIQEEITTPIANELLFGKLQKGGHIKISLVKGELTIHHEPALATT